MEYAVTLLSMRTLLNNRGNSVRRLPFLERLCTPPPFFPAVEIPSHLRKRTTGADKRERLLLWWLTYRLAVERKVDAAAVEDAAQETGLTPLQIDAIRAKHPIHWERMLLKRELRLEHHLQHGAVPEGVTPGWPLGRNVHQIGAMLHRKQRSAERMPRSLVKWLSVCSQAAQQETF